LLLGNCFESDGQWQHPTLLNSQALIRQVHHKTKGLVYHTAWGKKKPTGRWAWWMHAACITGWASFHSIVNEKIGWTFLHLNAWLWLIKSSGEKCTYRQKYRHQFSLNQPVTYARRQYVESMLLAENTDRT